MEKVAIYVKKFLALIFSFSLAPVAVILFALSWESIIIPGLPLTFLLFSFINFRITGDKPKFLFGLTQSDAFLTKKGGFWNLFKWIVNSLGFLYDLFVWTIWGVYLLFILFVDVIMFVKWIVYWLIHAAIWFLRQLFPPFIFLFRMFMHYIINWSWWIYQLAFRNMKISVNKNFYIIALWGTIPALFIVFLFYVISQMAGIDELVAISGLFALIPLVWSFGEISAIRFEGREKDDYSAVRYTFRNGWDAVKSVLFYVILAIILVVAEIILNLLGWIPNLSMSLVGISINLNMAISIILLFLTIIICFTDAIIPSHILYQPEHENNLRSSTNLLKSIGQKFLRYIFIQPAAWLFGGLLMVIPVVVIIFTFGITDSIKNGVMDHKIEQLTSSSKGMEALDEYRTNYKIQRLEYYKDLPEHADLLFPLLSNSGEKIESLKEQITEAEELLLARAGAEDEDFATWEHNQKESIAFLDADLKEQRNLRIQIPVLLLFVGIFMALFVGIVFAVYIAYIGNVYFELYAFREDEEPTHWSATIASLREKDGNQPLLGFTFLAIIIALIWVVKAGVLSGLF